MPGPDPFLLAASASLSSPPPFVSPLAYGPAPEVELIPYFYGLAAVAALALGAVLIWPLSVLLRRLRRSRDASTAEASRAPMTSAPQEAPIKGGRDSA